MPGPRNARKKKQMQTKKNARTIAKNRKSDGEPSPRRVSASPTPHASLPTTPQPEPPDSMCTIDDQLYDRDNTRIHDLSEFDEPDDDADAIPRVQAKTPCIHDPGSGARVRDMHAFLASSFAAPPALDDPMCAEFAQAEALEMLCLLLPEETAQILWYNKSRKTARVCPACQRLYRLGDVLPDPVAPQDDAALAYTHPTPLLRREQELSGLCSPVCFVLAAYHCPAAIRATWGRMAHELDDATWELVGAVGARADDMGLGMLLRMTRCHDLGLAQLLFPDLDVDVGGGGDGDGGASEWDDELRGGLERLQVCA